MPLNGTGGPLGSLLASAVGAGASAGSFFQQFGSVIAAWAPANIQVIPNEGTPPMVAAGGAIAGFGKFGVTGTKEDLGQRICAALTIPPTATSAVATWTTVADALIKHFKNLGLANGTGLTSGVPIVGGVGTLQWVSPVFAPPLAVQLGVSEPIAAAALLAFETGLLNHIQTNAVVVGLSLSGPPMSAPPDGPVVGTGTIS